MTQPGRIEEIVEEDTIEMPKVETKPEQVEQPNSRPQEPSSSHTIQPLFLERLEMKLKQPEFDLVSELRNVCIKIPLLQEIKDIQIYAKTVRDLCTKGPRRQKIELSTIQVGGNLASLMSTDFLLKNMQTLESLWLPPYQWTSYQEHFN